MGGAVRMVLLPPRLKRKARLLRRQKACLLAMTRWGALQMKRRKTKGEIASSAKGMPPRNDKKKQGSQ